MFFYLISRIFTSYGSSTRLTVHTSPTLWSMMTSASGVVFESLPLNGSASIVPTILNVTSWLSDKSKILTVDPNLQHSLSFYLPHYRLH